MRRVTALVGAPASTMSSPATTEFLRILAALRAYDVQIELFEGGAGRGSLSSSPDLDPDGERYLEALREDGVSVRPEAQLPEAIARADALLVLADPARPGRPAVLDLTRGEPIPLERLDAILEAGQVRLR